MVITREWIGLHATRPSRTHEAAGWTRQQLACLGVSWPPKKGWRSRLVGTSISDENAREFERLGMERRRKLVKNEVSLDPTW